MRVRTAKYKVYALYATDEPLQVRYVGITKQTLNARLRGHTHQQQMRNKAKRHWFDEVWLRGGEIQIRLLGAYGTEQEGAWAEKTWIAFWRQYCALFNVQAGGYVDRIARRKPLLRASLASWFAVQDRVGRKWWPELCRDRISELINFSPEQLERVSAGSVLK